MMYTTANRETITPVTFPAGLDVHWETETRVIWNERQLPTEREELISEVSWIRELGAWRRFPRSPRNVQN